MTEPVPVPCQFAAKTRAFAFCLNRSRFSVIVLLAGFGLLLSDQGRDLLIAYGEDGRIAVVAVTAAAWAVSIWFWCRVLLDIRYDDPPSCTATYRFWRQWMPRLLGAMAFVVLAAGAAQAGHRGLSAWALVALAVFLALVTWRRAGTRRVAILLERSSSRLLQGFAPAFRSDDFGPVPPHANLIAALGIPDRNARAAGEKLQGGAYFALGLVLVFAVCAGFGNLAPVWFGSRIGAMVLFFSWGATWLPLGSAVSYYADRRGYPLLSGLALLTLVSSYWNDNHEIRQREGALNPADRPTVTRALEDWGTANGARAGGAATPFVIVATAGGGIRAAYWTATVLGDLHWHAPAFAGRTFAVSGVSGGAVGATVYRALLEAAPEKLAVRCGPGYRSCGQEVLGHDFLGPLAAALLYPDFAQRFVPIPFFPDRGTALEQAWEQAFRDATDDDQLNASLSGLSRSRRGPALFLNSTWIDNGRRIVASDLRFASTEEDVEEGTAFARSNDQLAILGHDLRLSTAAHNSARFPFVSPPGMWRRADGRIAGRLQDGGLFENFGAETALEILDLACRRFRCGPASTGDATRRSVKPVVILISSDPTLPANLARSPLARPIHFAYEMRATLTAYENARNGRGAEAASRLQEWAQRNNGLFVQFRMCRPQDDEASPPLGWALSAAARDTIQGYLPEPGAAGNPGACITGNLNARAAVAKLLGGVGGSL